MPDQSLITFIKLGRADQLSDQMLTAQLQAKGWTQQQISDAYAAIDQAPWDPIKITQAEIQYDEAQEVILDSKDELLFDGFQHNPELIIRNIVLLFLLPILFGIILSKILDGGFFQYVVIGFLPLGFYFAYIKRTAGRIVMEQVAKQTSWIFLQGQDRARIEKLKMFYPEIFQFGNDDSQSIENQYWGTIPINNQSKPFWQATFNYVVGSGKSRQMHSENVYAFPLVKPMTNTFSIIPNQGFLSGLTAIKTESIDFNKAFIINYTGQLEKMGPHIFETLTPVIQEQLLNLHSQ